MKLIATPAKIGTNSREWPTVLAFCAIPFLVGAAVAQIGLGLRQLSPPWRYPTPWPPLTLFWLVWTVIYPSWGYATYLVWRKRNQADVRGAMALALTMLVSGLVFMPNAALTGYNPVVMTLGDANGVVSSCILAWLYSRYDRRAVWFLVPLLVWMPITLGLKIWYWRSNL